MFEFIGEPRVRPNMPATFKSKFAWEARSTLRFIHSIALRLHPKAITVAEYFPTAMTISRQTGDACREIARLL